MEKSFNGELSESIFAISQLQGDAWAAWNASYHAQEPDTFRRVSRSLYRQDVHERITSLFARSEEQNRQLDELLNRAA